MNSGDSLQRPWLWSCVSCLASMTKISTVVLFATAYIGKMIMWKSCSSNVQVNIFYEFYESVAMQSSNLNFKYDAENISKALALLIICFGASSCLEVTISALFNSLEFGINLIHWV